KTGTTQNNADGWFILMHPNLVAGAWVGFNDNRVNMRSAYWGQGGHNAVLLVGDFFKTALDSGKLDKTAQFPGGPRVAVPRQEEQMEVIEEPGDLRQEGEPPPPPEEPAEAEPVQDEAPPPDRRQDRQAQERQARDAEVDRQIEQDRQFQQERQESQERRNQQYPQDQPERQNPDNQ
ncbi:MAG TPA: hypothetical protein VFS02_01490, partial [Telluria sp.]|nr:hypothetical protein [Telluria sp.]